MITSCLLKALSLPAGLPSNYALTKANGASLSLPERAATWQSGSLTDENDAPEKGVAT